MADAAPDPILPPPYRAHRLADPAAVAATARARASALGAGALVFGAAEGRLALAVVLEPETPLAEARLALYAGASALAEALAASCPPERTVTIAWPATLRYAGAEIGAAWLHWPETAGPRTVPDWLVLAAELGGGDDAREATADPTALIEGFAAHLMRNLDTWAAEGFPALAERYRRRLAAAGRITPEGDLDAPAGRRPLEPALAGAGR